MMTASFIHLNVHTEYSLIDSTIRIDELIKSTVAYGIPAIAITDYLNLFALIKFYRAAMAAGVKPIVGTTVAIVNPQDVKHPFQAILLCKNNVGYHNLTELISQTYLEGQESGQPLLQRHWLANKAEGLILLSGAQYGDVGQAILSGKVALAEQLMQEWAQLFPTDYYIEVSRCGQENEEFYVHNVLQLAEKYQLPVVATNPVRFMAETDFTAHEARVCIHEGFMLGDERRPKRYTPAQYYRSPQEMLSLFHDIPSAIKNTVEIAKRCNTSLSLGKTYLPNFPIPAHFTPDAYFRHMAWQGLEKRLAIIFKEHPEQLPSGREKYDNRLKLELDVIIQMGFPGYFLIVADFIQWAKAQQIPVGPGRGSGPGSLVAYALYITDLDPIFHGLLFERFLNPERVSMPDFDIDFCMDGRDQVIEYVAQTYGRNAVSQIITYGTMAAKAVVRDVGRVLGHPYGFVDKLAKLIPFELGITLEKALEQDETLHQRYQQEDEVRELFNLALKLEGLTRNVGKHAGGVVIAPSKLTDFTPIYTESAGSSLVSQFDKDDVEAVGLVKFDFLGLRTLTIIDWAVHAINKSESEKTSTLDIGLLPLNDSPTFELLKACNTTAVFQLESRGMKDLINRLQPDRFEDIVALVALFRPGPLQSGMVEDFIDRKHGRAVVEYPHPALESVLKETYGVILYQEQVMQIAQVLAGYTLGGADLLRRAMGKKKPEEMAQQRTIFTEGAVKNGVSLAVATHIFDLMEKFAGYGFNKSHSAAYALLTYQTAWLKAHYPAQFMAAVLSSDMDNTDKVLIFFEDTKLQKLTILPPDINASEYKFIAVDPQTIRYGLGAIKGAGQSALTTIIQNRKEEGSFVNLFEFCQRVDLRKVNRRVLEGLIKSGAFDSFGQDRAILLASLEKALKQAEQSMSDREMGQTDLFGMKILNEVQTLEYAPAIVFTERERLEAEKESLGLYLSGHPLQAYLIELRSLTSSTIKDLQERSSQSLRIGGIITNIRTLNTKRGDRMAVINIDDLTGKLDVPIFPEMYQSFREGLEKDKIIIIEGDLQADRFTGGQRFNTRLILSFEQARQKYAKMLVIQLVAAEQTQSIIDQLKELLEPYKGGSTTVLIHYQREEAIIKLNLPTEWKIRLTDNIVTTLQKLLGNEAVTVVY
jgi:DNA polymerase-3 subunit alpha